MADVVVGRIGRGLVVPTSYDGARAGAPATLLFERFVVALRASGAFVATGRFGADMQVRPVNDGPLTLVIDTETSRRARLDVKALT